MIFDLILFNGCGVLEHHHQPEEYIVPYE